MAKFVRFKYIPRPTLLPLPPATCQINNRALVGKGPSFKLTDRFINWVKVNNGEQEARYLLKDRSGWVNWNLTAESVTMAGNVAEVEYVSGNFAKLVTLHPNSPLPALGNILLSHKFTCVTSGGVMRLPADGIHAFFPFVILGEAYIRLDKVDVFESMPAPLWPGVQPDAMPGYAAIVLKGTVVRQSPGGNKIYVAPSDFEARVTSEVQGWAKIGDKRWCELSRIRRQ